MAPLCAVGCFLWTLGTLVYCSDRSRYGRSGALRLYRNCHSAYFFFFFFQITTQLQYIEDSEPVVDESRNRWCAL